MAATFAQRFMELYPGMEEAYGTYVIDENATTPAGKKQGKALTKREKVTVEHWKRHIEGQEALGIVPIRKDSSCFWGAIDIDIYNMDIETLARKVYAKGIPFIPVRSKSGGCHLTVYLSESVPARDVQAKLWELASYLGFGDSEIFPKQARVLVDKGDLGNWLNMPYFGGESSTRYALDAKGDAMPVGIFLGAAEEARITGKQLAALSFKAKESELSNGPPCLEALCEQGFPQGTRNAGLFALGVYCRKAHPDDWKTQMEDMNMKFMNPPLASQEVQTIKKQTEKKTYNYSCKDQPLRAFCNADVCRTRAFGVGGGFMPTLSALRKIPTDEPLWFIEVNGRTVELTTEQLQVQPKFQRQCMDALNLMPPQMKQKDWQTLVQTLMDSCVELDKPEGASVEDQFYDWVDLFLKDSKMYATTREELLLGRPWVEDEPGKDPQKEVVYFRLRDVDDYLKRMGFKHSSYNKTKIASTLRDGKYKAKSHIFNIKGQSCGVYYMAVPEKQTTPFETPKIVGDVL